MNNEIKKRAFLSLWLPCLWSLLLVIEVIILAEKNLNHLFLRLFEILVFLMSFLFFTTGGVEQTMGSHGFKLFILFSLQFFFWWIVSFLLLTYKTKKKEML